MGQLKPSPEANPLFERPSSKLASISAIYDGGVKIPDPELEAVSKETSVIGIAAETSLTVRNGPISLPRPYSCPYHTRLD